jgi:alkylated DNA nucleotide flippase Atl1
MNRMAIIVPCHRVVQSDGTLGGYGGGLWRKHWLLALEARHAEGVPDGATGSRRPAPRRT